MWALADLRDHAERSEWWRKFGTEFTGFHEGRPVRYTWREIVTGHVCVGAGGVDGHLQCIRLYSMRWCWLRSKA